MRKSLIFVGVVALVAMLAVPAVASAALTNEYGMTFVGQSKCLECHDISKAATVHGRFAKQGLVPSAPASWTVFKAAGDPPVTAGTGNTNFKSGGTYPIGMTWVTLGDYAGGAATEYLFWKGSSAATISPWNLVEGLIAEPWGEWMVGNEAPNTGLYDVTYGCQRCHMLGTTKPTASASATSVVPNPQVSVAATYTTGYTWARPQANSVAQFLSDPAVSYAGLGIACEQCHGTGFDASGETMASRKHLNSGTQISNRMQAAGSEPTATNATLGNSQACGQCHGSYTDATGTLGIYGYTANLPLRKFVNINGVDKDGYSYTYTPTEAEFLAKPTKYYLFPNGSNAKGNHFYYNEWSTSGHAYRGAYFNATSGHSEDPDDLVGGKAGHYNAKTSGLDCARCHTGEGYMKSKGPLASADYWVSGGIWADFTPTNSNVGFMGQECVVCHDPHPAGVGMASNIRPADPAGVRSNAGLTTANATLCEDCHNWQYEVQGTSPSIKPLAALTSRGGPSHPQRETLHGKVMLEVPTAGEFMPGAKCEECHMPKTNKNANRFSHGMHIMRPGDAKAWNAAAGAAYKGEDSCSPCHPGETQDELEANLEDWQAAATAAADEAAAAITAAQARGNAEYSLTDAAKPGYILVGRATWNYKAFGSDGSGGAHNPEYVVSGLKKSTQMAKSVGGSFALLGSSSSVSAGSLGYVAGKVVNGDGTGAASADLTLLNGAGAVVGTTKSDANGNFAFTVAPTATTTYRVVWARSSVAATHISSGNTTIAVAAVVTPPPSGGAKTATTTTIARSTSAVRLGGTFIISGSVRPSAAGGLAVVMVKKPGAIRYSYSSNRVLNASSDYWYRYKPLVRGTFYFYTVYGGNASLAASQSGVLSVAVR